MSHSHSGSQRSQHEHGGDPFDLNQQRHQQYDIDSPFDDPLPPHRQNSSSPSLSSPGSSPYNQHSVTSMPYQASSARSETSTSRDFDDYYHQQDSQEAPRPLSYFPTHHQPLANNPNEFEMDEDAHRRDSSRYSYSHNQHFTPLEHAPSALSPQWGGNETKQQPTSSAAMSSRGMDPQNSYNQYNPYGVDGGGVGAADVYNAQAPLPPLPPPPPGSAWAPPPGAPPPQEQPFNDSESRYEDGSKIPKVLRDPKVQEQLHNRKSYKPWFVWFVSTVQVLMLLYEIVNGYQRTHKIIETSPFNVMIGPGTGTIIHVGARFVPCMRSTSWDTKLIQCPDNANATCTLSDICGFAPIVAGQAPNQWFRFITPIFLHGGVLHLLFNLMFQLRTGAELERDMGWWRFAIIYLTSGIVGFVFGANFAPITSPSMGASGAIFGLIGCLVLDLIQNWKLVIRPCWELSKLMFMILFTFALGLLPLLDNFSHIGGFFAGILTGLVFMPTIYYSKRDRYIKWGLRIVALPLVIIILYLGITNFYKGAPNNCTWCRYFSCLPIKGWCDAFDNNQ